MGVGTNPRRAIAAAVFAAVLAAPHAQAQVKGSDYAKCNQEVEALAQAIQKALDGDRTVCRAHGHCNDTYVVNFRYTIIVTERQNSRATIKAYEAQPGVPKAYMDTCAKQRKEMAELKGKLEKIQAQPDRQ